MITLFLLTICAALLVVSLSVNYVLIKTAPRMIYDVGTDIVAATIERYMPELKEGNAAGRPAEGLMGFLNTPIGQQIINMIMQRLKGGGTVKQYKPGIYG